MRAREHDDDRDRDNDAALKRRVVQLERDRERYREALVRIASSESGRWGWIARDALREVER